MVVVEDVNRAVKKQDLIYLAILSAVCLGIGIYLIVTTVLIAQDGISYINYAKGLAAGDLEIIRDCSGYAPRTYTPGYPFLVLVMHKVVDFFGDGSTVWSWIYSAQAVSLICRILAIIVLYFLGKEFVGGKLSFWALLILAMLPYPAKFGSDTLRDWPYILFLATGFLFLLWGVSYGKWLIFALVGIVAGLGYMVRPMCAQLVVYGVLWLIFNIFGGGRKCGMSRAKLVWGLALLVIGFAVVAGPYMKIRGEVLPRRLQQIMESFSCWFAHNTTHEQNVGSYAAKLVPSDIAKAFEKLIGTACGNLMYYFVPALLIGIYCHFRRKPKSESTFLITAFILLNLTALILRYCCCGLALSRRYVLPLTAFTIFFVPVGLQIMARWVERVVSKRACQNGSSEKKSQGWFFILLIVGLGICVPKLFRPIRIEKKGYRLAAAWLKKNTTREDVIAVTDGRISFYAERKGKISLRGRFPANAKYFVKRIKEQKGTPAGMTEVWSSYLDKRKKRDKVVIYQRI